jgi:hypothetical protein
MLKKKLDRREGATDPWLSKKKWGQTRRLARGGRERLRVENRQLRRHHSDVSHALSSAWVSFLKVRASSYRVLDGSAPPRLFKEGCIAGFPAAGSCAEGLVGTDGRSGSARLVP